MIDELQLGEHMLCPNTTYFFVEGGITGDQLLQADIYAYTDTVESGKIEQIIIFTSEIVRYFTPEEYNKNGYQSAITLTEDVIYPVKMTK